MTLVQRQQRELRYAVLRAMRTHGNVRDAAAAVGLPRSTFHDYLQAARPRKRSRR